jgi:hypothetical protein
MLCPILLALALFRVSPAHVSAAKQQQAAAPAPALDYSALANDVINNLATRQFQKVSALFDATVAAAIPPDKLPGVWDQVVAQGGAFRKIDSSKVIEQPGYHVATVTCEFEKGNLNIILAFDPHGQISGLFFTPVQNSQPAPAASSWAAPAYADPAKFHEVSFTVSDGQW